MNAVSMVLEFLALVIVLPLLYFLILAFDLLLIVRSRNLEQRLRGIAGAIGGFLVAIVIIILQIRYDDPLVPGAVDQSFDMVGASTIIALVLGFLLLIVIDLLLRRGVVPFIIMFTIAGVIVSAYYLTKPDMRFPTSVASIGFMIGMIIYFMLFPTRIFNQLYGS